MSGRTGELISIPYMFRGEALTCGNAPRSFRKYSVDGGKRGLRAAHGCLQRQEELWAFPQVTQYFS
jgi:hypothetical protein